MREYKCLTKQLFILDEYSLVPIRDEDKYDILKWRNEQIEILRQNKIISEEEQDRYFTDVVAKLFEVEYPNQILWSFLENGKLIGYGGLVHIDWESKVAEISFLTETKRSVINSHLDRDWSFFLKILKIIAFRDLNYKKIYTYAYSSRTNLFPILLNSDFIHEATLKNHAVLKNRYYDVYYHSLENNSFDYLEPANPSDANLFFIWRNEEQTRLNSINTEEVKWEEHKDWFEKKLKSDNVKIFKLIKSNTYVGRIRIEFNEEIATLSYSIDSVWRGKGLGKRIIKEIMHYIYFYLPNLNELHAVVKESNIASFKIFESLGFKKHPYMSGLVIFKKTIYR